MGSIFENFSIYCPKNSNLYLINLKKKRTNKPVKIKLNCLLIDRIIVFNCITLFNMSFFLLWKKSVLKK